MFTISYVIIYAKLCARSTVAQVHHHQEYRRRRRRRYYHCCYYYYYRPHRLFYALYIPIMQLNLLPILCAIVDTVYSLSFVYRVPTFIIIRQPFRACIIIIATIIISVGYSYTLSACARMMHHRSYANIFISITRHFPSAHIPSRERDDCYYYHYYVNNAILSSE